MQDIHPIAFANFDELFSSSLCVEWLGNIPFAYSDPEPEVVISTGIHGDEWQVIPILTKVILRLKDTLPSFLYLPVVSPSSVAQESRTNAQGHDLNRIFNNPEYEDEEIQAVKKIMLRFKPYHTVMTVHQDLELEDVYLYDAHSIPNDPKVTKWQETMREQGIQLLNGVDDPLDPTLGIEFIDGYFNFDPLSGKFEETFESWSTLHAGANRNMTLDCPGIVSDEKLELIVEQSLLTLL